MRERSVALCLLSLFFFRELPSFVLLRPGVICPSLSDIFEPTGSPLQNILSRLAVLCRRDFTVAMMENGCAARFVLPWQYLRPFFEVITVKSKNIQVQCKLCMPKINVLSAGLTVSSNLRKHIMVSGSSAVGNFFPARFWHSWKLWTCKECRW